MPRSRIRDLRRRPNIGRLLNTATGNGTTTFPLSKKNKWGQQNLNPIIRRQNAG